MSFSLDALELPRRQEFQAEHTFEMRHFDELEEAE
jgi:hypothetical protein